MEHLDDFPKRDGNHKIQEVAETAFRTSISQCACFHIQQEDRRDYGTDFQLEVINNDSMTNVRIHVQVKGTECQELSDDSVSRSVAKSNLNYLLQQPCSIYVCYHVPTKRLLVRYVEDVYREYEHQGSGWRNQKSVTVNFIHKFDIDFQEKLKDRSLTLAKQSRNERILYSNTPPNQFSTLIEKTKERVIVPADYNQAKMMLKEFYHAGKDEAISNSFDQFQVELSFHPKDMLFAYMAEINLGINGVKVDEDRIRVGIEEIGKVIELECFDLGSLLYSMGNGWLALKEYEKARDVYNNALVELSRLGSSDLSAQCYKNMGSVMEHLSDDESVALGYYKKALELSPQLAEAHFALALCYRKKQNFSKVLEHLDQVVFIRGYSDHSLSLQGWRVEALFNNGDAGAAFREINSLISNAGKSHWVWPWCARQVMVFGRDSIESSKKAISFWNLYLQENSMSLQAKQERLLCLLNIRFHGEDTDFDFDTFKNQALEVIEGGDVDIAFWWDRVGHWAQCDNDWIEAEANYRKAFDLEPELYGYCLGTALNFLGEFEEAFPILLEQAENHLPDAKSWFQVAVACEGLDDFHGCLFAYQKAIDLDPDYDLAWFNLGGYYWNFGAEEEAMEIWRKAVTRFPDHDLTKELQQNFPDFLTN
ncbi:DUF4365 domain-containing protein [Microbulbifer sp. JMSA002]|uniref:DUF4365 domain-containing protein n=1 Tax=Microbulbifer sp. JMSA002 TaxID=3243368 RepID=UPI00403902B6